MYNLLAQKLAANCILCQQSPKQYQNYKETKLERIREIPGKGRNIHK